MKRFVWLVVGLLLVACGGNDTPVASPTTAPHITPTATPNAGIRLQQAGEAMANLDSVGVTIRRTGGAVYLDVDDTLILNEATGYYVAPDALMADVKVTAAEVVLEMQAISIGDEAWLATSLTNQWEKLPPGWRLDLLGIFDKEKGWRPILRDHVSNVRLVDTTTFGDVTRLQIRATVAGEQVQVINPALSSGEDLTVDFWLDPITNYVVQMSFTTQTEGEPADWRFTFDQFNVDVTIEPPLP